MSKTRTKNISQFHYLSGRPFLAVKVYIGIEKGVRTENAGWNKQRENLDLKEEPLLLYRISDKTMQEASVIIDILHNKIVKNRYRRASKEVTPELLDEQILSHFKTKYHDLISQAKLRVSL